MKITRGKKIMPRRVLLYGTHGIGKSSWAAQAPDVLFLNLEDGLNDIEADKTEHLESLDLVSLTLGEIDKLQEKKDEKTQKPKYQWLAIDTIDWLEALVHQEVAREAGKRCIGDIRYGEGYKSAQAHWDNLLKQVDWLRSERNMGIILLAHTAIVKFRDPMGDSYDRFQPALHDTASATLQEWADEVLFACYRVTTRKQDEGFGKERVIAGGSGERLLRCTETPGALAKNRLGMPDTIEFSWAAYQAYFPQAAATTTATPSAAGNISGVVVEGSSKK